MDVVKKQVKWKRLKRLRFWVLLADAVLNLAGLAGGLVTAYKSGIQGIFDNVAIPIYIALFGTFFASDMLYFLFSAKGKRTSVTGPMTGVSICIKAGLLFLLLFLSCFIGAYEVLPKLWM